MTARGRPIRPVLAAAVAVASVAVSWFVLAAVLAVDRGLDITDEGLYLLSADPPTPTATWQFPFGWHTGPLMSAVDHDLADFRTLGAVILVAVSAWLGFVSVRVVAARSGQTETPSVAIAGAVVGAVGSLLYYGGFLRTPSYNWINLTGITLAAAAQIAYVGLLAEGKARPRMKASLLAVGSFGLFYALPGKPSTPVLMAVVGFFLIALVSGLRRAFSWTAALTAATLGWIGLAAFVGWWPAGFSNVFLVLFEGPNLTDAHSLGGAILSLISSPIRPFQLLATPNSSPLLTVGTAIGLISLVVGVFGVWGGRPTRWMRPAAIAGLVTSSLVLVNTKLIQDSQVVVGRWAHAPAVTAGLFVVCAALMSGWPMPAADSPSRATSPTERLTVGERLSSWAVTGYLISLPFIFGFGSGQGAYDQAARAAGIFLIAAITVLLLGCAEDLTRRAVIIGVVTIAMATITIVHSRQAPYRNPPISEHNVVVAVGPEEHSLHVDPDLAGVLMELDEKARDAAWIEGTPILGLQWRWSTTIPYFLGGRPPDSLMLTIFGYVGTVERAAYNLEHLGTFPIEDAWVIATTPSELTPLGVEQTRKVTDVLVEASGRPFPDDYICVAQVASFQLWKPAKVESPNAVCPPSGISSSYNASVGWDP